MIDVLPEIIRTHPDVIYTFWGRLIPHVRKQNGEEYCKACSSVKVFRLAGPCFIPQSLCRITGTVRISGSRRFVSLLSEPYTDCLRNSRVFLWGAGKAVLSTPYWHAEELLAEGRGVWFHSGTLRLWRNRLMICWIMKLSETRFAGERTNTAARWSGHRWRITCVCSGGRRSVHHPRPPAQVAKQSPVEDHRLPEIDLRHLLPDD